MNSLVTNNHFNLVLTLARHVLSFDEYKVQCCIINLQLICPLYDKFWPLRLHRLINVNFKQKVAQFLLILIRKNIKLLVKKRDSLHVWYFIYFIDVHFLSIFQIEPKNICIGSYETNFLRFIESDIIWLSI